MMNNVIHQQILLNNKTKQMSKLTANRSNSAGYKSSFSICLFFESNLFFFFLNLSGMTIISSHQLSASRKQLLFILLSFLLAMDPLVVAWQRCEQTRAALYMRLNPDDTIVVETFKGRYEGTTYPFYNAFTGNDTLKMACCPRSGTKSIGYYCTDYINRSK